MKTHIIIDMHYIFYRYKFLLDAGKMRTLSSIISGETLEEYNALRECYGLPKSTGQIDTSYIYYPIRTIEAELKPYLASTDELTISMCFDSHTVRQAYDANTATTYTGYKSNRIGKLSQEDRFNLDYIRLTLSKLGYNIYKIDGCEADDIIHALCNLNAYYDRTIVYSPDADILVNLTPPGVTNPVVIYRYKTSTKMHTLYTADNFSELMSAEYKCSMPFNCIILYKSLCGDKSDMIPGIKGYGPKAFDKLIAKLTAEGMNFIDCLDPAVVENIIRSNFEGDKLEQALDALSLVRSIQDIPLEIPTSLDRGRLRELKNVYYMGELQFNL